MSKPHGQIVAERRQRLIEQGLCVSCGAEPAVEVNGRRQQKCAGCRERHHAQQHQSYMRHREARIAAARAQYHRDPDRYREVYRERAATRRAAGICQSCGVRPVEHHDDGRPRAYCQPCRERRNAQRRAREARR